MNNAIKQLLPITLLFFIMKIGYSQSFEGTNFSNTNPIYYNLPVEFNGSESYSISFKTSEEAIKALVPQPLTPATNGNITLVFAKHKVVAPVRFNYNEAYLITPVSFDNKYGVYCIILYLDKIMPVTVGREIWGYNKVGGDFNYYEKDGVMTITLSQMDTVIIKAKFVLGESLVPSSQPGKARVINLKYIPSVIKDAPPDVMQLTTSPTIGNLDTHLQKCTAELEFYPTSQNPLDQIPILEIVKAQYQVGKFTMINGEVLYDYLKKGE